MKAIVSYRTGIKIFTGAIILGLLVFGVFYLIQNNKDKKFQAGRPNMKAFKKIISNRYLNDKTFNSSTTDANLDNSVEGKTK